MVQILSPNILAICLDSGGSPVSNETVNVVASSDCCGDPGGSYSMSTNANGEALFECLPGDKYEVTACDDTQSVDFLPQIGDPNCDSFTFDSGAGSYTKTVTFTCGPAGPAPITVTLFHDLGNFNDGTPINQTITYGVYNEQIRIWEWDDFSDQDHIDSPKWELELSSQTDASGFVEIREGARRKITAGKLYKLEFVLWSAGGLTGQSSIPIIDCSSVSGPHSTGTYYNPNDTGHLAPVANTTWVAVDVTGPTDGTQVNIRWGFVRNVIHSSGACTFPNTSTTIQNFAGQVNGTSENVLQCNGSYWYANSVNNTWGYATVQRGLLVFFAPYEVYKAYHVICRCTFNHQGYQMIDAANSGFQWQWCTRAATGTRYALGNWTAGIGGTNVVVVSPVATYADKYLIALGFAQVYASMMQGVAARLDCIRVTTPTKPAWS